MERTWKSFNMNIPKDTQEIGAEIERRWHEVESIPGVVKYRLNVRKERVLEGKYGIYLQLNVERGTQRRPPIVMESLRPEFDVNAFNFTKITDNEHMMDIRFQDLNVAIIVNQSPLCKFHCLIVPELEACLPQVLTPEAIQFSIRFLRVLNNYHFLIGYNSPGALASVNHLHLHLLHTHHDLFVNKADLHKLRSGIYQFSPESAIKGICFLIRGISYDDHEIEATGRIYQLVRYMIDNNMAHNIVFGLSKYKGIKVVRIVVFPRDRLCAVKDTTELNIAFCELSGFVSVANERTYKQLTEEQFLDIVRQEQCGAFENLVIKVKDSHFYPHRRKRKGSLDADSH